MKKQIKFYLLLASAAMALLVGCERDWNNPWDEFTTLSPEAWAPQNLQITDVTITEKKLTWTYGEQNIEGFKLDRKKGDEPWQVAYQTFPKETREWSDTGIIPDPSLTYEYRLYAFAGKNSSSGETKSLVASFTAPTNLQIEQMTDKSYKLSWLDNSTGEQGFKIDRKIDENTWKIAYGIVPENQTNFIDTNVFRELNVEYRVYAFYEGHVSSNVTIGTVAELSSLTNLVITNNSISSVTLTWQTNGRDQDGFRIERKYEGSDWFQIATAANESYTDTNFQLNTHVYYRICAYVGQYNSSFVENNFDSQIPPPTNLQITPNSISSVTLTWQDNSIGEEGFKVDRKKNSGAWETNYATVNSNQRIFTDNNLNWQLPSDVYYYRVYGFLGRFNSNNIEITLSNSMCGAFFIDTRDNHVYETIEIGNQCWMKENLAYLPSVSPSSNGSEISPSYYVYDYQGTSVTAAKETANYQNYGVLYNWPASLTVCPEEWHLPSDAEWTTLTDYLGGESVAGGKMKETGTLHWQSPNNGATNSSGFTGLPAGSRGYTGSFSNIGGFGYWWCSTEHSASSGWLRRLEYNDTDIYHYYYIKSFGFSVRCLRD